LKTQKNTVPVNANRLITQTTDSILLPSTLFFSERIQNGIEMGADKQVEFYLPQNTSKFLPGSISTAVDLQPDQAYVVGLLSKPIYGNTVTSVFLLRDATEKSYRAYINQAVNSFIRNNKLKVEIEIKKGKLGYAWVILRGNAINQTIRILSSISPENACLNLRPKTLESYIAGLLDARINKPLYGGNYVLTFSMEESGLKRFLHNVLLLYNSQIFETSCITSHAPKFLESSTMLSKSLPIKNPAWDFKSDKKISIFSRVRGITDIKTHSVAIMFEEQGFSPIVDGLYTYPSVLK